MVRWRNWVLIRNAFPERQNLCMEGDPSHPAGAELWKMHAADKLNKNQLDIFLKPRPALELFDVSKDPHQLRNLADDRQHAAVLTKLIGLLDRWSDETGDTVPKNPTPDRQTPQGKRFKGWKHATQPGTERNATKINHPGPIRD